MERVRYEIRKFSQLLSVKDKTPRSIDLINPLENICYDLGGCSLNLDEIDDEGEIHISSKLYLVGKRNGTSAFVNVAVVYNHLTNVGCRETTITNVENYEHKELLAALHNFYNGESGY